jgi:hypothetical protein
MFDSVTFKTVKVIKNILELKPDYNLGDDEAFILILIS